MRILVTGGSGFIGQRVVERLVERDHNVVVMSRRPQIFLDAPEKVETVSGDIREFSDVMKTVSDSGIDRIIHVAYTLTAEGEANPLLALQVNCLGTCNVFEAARLYGIKRVIFCSSIAAYAPTEYYGERAVTEDEDLMKPVSIYGATKVLNEFMASRFEARYGTEICSLRISGVYGTGREERGVTAWTSQIVSGAVRERPVFVRLRSTQRACFIYVDDVAEQVVRLAFLDRPNFRIYNSGGYTATPKDFTNILKKYYPNVDVTFDEDAPLWPYPPEVDGTKLEKDIGFKIRDPEDGLLEQVNQERARLEMRPLQRIA